MVQITLWPAMGELALVFRQRHWKRGYFFAGVCSDLRYAFFFYLVNAHNGVHRDIRTLYAFKFAAQSVLCWVYEHLGAIAKHIVFDLDKTI